MRRRTRSSSTPRTASGSDRPAARLLAAWESTRAVDHHCHTLRRWPAHLQANELRACFTEAVDERVLAEHVICTPVYRRMLRRLAPVFGCRPNESAILTARDMLEPARYARELLELSGTGMMLVDSGYQAADAMTFEEQRSAVPIQQREIVRVEHLAEGLVAPSRRAEDWLDAVRAGLERAVRGGAVAVKSIVAYRSTLRVRWPDHREVRESFLALRQGLRSLDDRPRVCGEPLSHALLLTAAEECVRLGVPLQVHCGLGDPDEDIGEASPSGLRAVLTHERFRDLRIVLLHCYPFHREAAYLCSVHAGVYMDLSLAIPLAATDGARAMREVVGICPWTKLLYASDASRLPELFLVAAELHREALAEAYGELVDAEFLSLEEARDAGRLVLAGNARRLYGL